MNVSGQKLMRGTLYRTYRGGKFKVFVASSLVFVLMFSFATTGMAQLSSNATVLETYQYVVYNLGCPDYYWDDSFTVRGGQHRVATTDTLNEYLTNLGIIPKCFDANRIRPIVSQIRNNESCILNICRQHQAGGSVVQNDVLRTGFGTVGIDWRDGGFWSGE